MLGQRKLLSGSCPASMHAFIFWGFLVLFPTIVMAMIAAVDKHAELPWLGRQSWFGWLVDLFVVLVLVGVVTAVVIRKVVRPKRFEGSHLGEADFILLMIAGVVVTLLCWHAAAHAQGLNEWHAGAAVGDYWRGRSRRWVTKSGSSCGRTSLRPRASCATCRTRSTCTSRRRR